MRSAHAIAEKTDRSRQLFLDLPQLVAAYEGL